MEKVKQFLLKQQEIKQLAMALLKKIPASDWLILFLTVTLATQHIFKIYSLLYDSLLTSGSSFRLYKQHMNEQPASVWFELKVFMDFLSFSRLLLHVWSENNYGPMCDMGVGGGGGLIIPFILIFFSFIVFFSKNLIYNDNNYNNNKK